MWLRNATLADGSVADVEIDQGLIRAVAPAGTRPEAGDGAGEELSGYVLVPSLVEPHAHLDKALLADRVPNPNGDLMSAILGIRAYYAQLTPEDVAQRAKRAALIGLGHGATAIRTHVDTGDTLGLRSLEAVLEVREELRPRIDVQVVALIATPTGGVDGAANLGMLKDALQAGADVGGGCPHIDPDHATCLSVCFETAAAFERPIDLHMDETLEATSLDVREFARMVRESGYPYGATASHCVSLGVQDRALASDVAAEIAESGVAVVTLPQTNLFLQARGMYTTVPRGLTAVRPLIEAGATLAAGGDNVRDPFNAMGRGDPLETASLMVTAGHLTPAEAFASVTVEARKVMGLPTVEVAPGFPADLLAIRATSLADALAGASQERMVWKGGRLVARTTVTQEFP